MVQGIQIQDSTGVGFTKDSPWWDGQSAGNTDTRWYWGGAYHGQSQTGWPKCREHRSKMVLGWGLPGIVPNGMAKGLGIQIQDNIGVGLTRDSPKWDGQSAGNIDPRQCCGGSYQGQSQTGWPKYREYRSKKVLGWGLPGTVPDGMAKVQGIQIQKGIGVGLTRDSPRWDGQSTGNTDPKRYWGGAYQGQSQMGWPKYREYRSKAVLGRGLPGIVPAMMSTVETGETA